VPDLTNLNQYLEATAFAVVSAGLPVAAACVKQHLTFIQNQALRSTAGDAVDRIEALAEKGAAVGYAWAQAHAVSIDHPAIQSAVIEQGVNFVAQFGAEELQASGYTPDQVAKLVNAGLGKLLAADPNVSIAGAATVIPPAPAAPAAVLPATPNRAPPAIRATTDQPAT
jgi:hypothetical protein